MPLTRSFRSQVALALVLTALIPLVVLIGYQMSYLIKAKEQQTEEQKHLTTLLVSEVRLFVEMHRRGIEAAAAQVTQTGRRDKATYDAILASLERQFPGFINLYFANRHGITQSFYPEFNSRGESMVGVDFSSRWHFQALLRNPKTYISPVMKGVGGTDKRLCTIVSPFYDSQGKFEGFILGALNLEKLRGLVQTMGPKHALVFIVDPIGQSVYSPTWQPTANPEKIALDLGNVNPLSTDAPQSFTHYLSVAGEEVYTTAQKLDNPEWTVYVSIPNSVRNANFGQLLFSGILFFTITLVLTFALSKALANRLSAAIEILSKKALKIKSHDIVGSRQLHLPAHSPQETLQLESVLNEMGEAIEDSRHQLLKINETLENRVQRRTAFLRAILTSLTDPFCIVDETGRIMLPNPAFFTMLGVKPTETSLSSETVLDALARQGLMDSEDLREVLQKPGETLLTNERETQYWLVTSFAIETVHEEPLAVSGEVLGVLFRDITQERKLDNMKSALIAIAAHEFKSPVASLKLSAETLARQDTHWDPDDVSDMIAGMLEDTARLERLIADWLDVSRMEAGDLVLHYQTVLPSDVVTQCVGLLSKTETFTFSLINQAPHCQLVADRQRILQILLNLMTNAIRYCDRAPEIIVTITADDSSCYFVVSDNGIGIDAEDLPHIFERFHQVERGLTRRAGGTGLGLSIARGLALAHGGTLTVESVVGKGSTFTLRLPLNPPPLVQSSK